MIYTDAIVKPDFFCFISEISENKLQKTEWRELKDC